MMFHNLYVNNCLIIGKENTLFYLFASFAGVSVLDMKRLKGKITLNSNVKRKKNENNINDYFFVFLLQVNILFLTI